MIHRGFFFIIQKRSFKLTWNFHHPYHQGHQQLQQELGSLSTTNGIFGSCRPRRAAAPALLGGAVIHWRCFQHPPHRPALSSPCPCCCCCQGSDEQKFSWAPAGLRCRGEVEQRLQHHLLPAPRLGGSRHPAPAPRQVPGHQVTDRGRAREASLGEYGPGQLSPELRPRHLGHPGPRCTAPSPTLLLRSLGAPSRSTAPIMKKQHRGFRS